jgi:hypothetical protein
MRILITSIGIVNRTGAEIVAMDLAAGFARLGHSPMIWAPRLNRLVAGPLLAMGIPVVSGLNELPIAPDIIHGHHHLETVEALRRFPDVPAIHVCHGGYWWHEAPPRHARIRRYVAVDEFCHERLSAAGWIPAERIETIGNAVDLRRHKPRRRLPSRPRRALIFSNYATRESHVDPVREACGRLGIEVDTMGSGMGNQSATPERTLPRYHLVFAKARCAMEAMATGCAVILCDASGLGPMVKSGNVERLRPWNFGFRTLERPLRTDLIRGEIERYDAADAAEVCNYIRDHAGLDGALDRYLALYRTVLEEPDTAAVNWHPATRRFEVADQAALRLRFLSVPETAAAGSHFVIQAGLYNGTHAPVATAAPWPFLLMYRWFDGAGRMEVEHGLQTIVQPPAWPGAESFYSMRVVAPGTPGDYVLRATLMQESWRWFDALDPAVCAESPVRVTARGDTE